MADKLKAAAPAEVVAPANGTKSNKEAEAGQEEQSPLAPA
jgi:hypothetical protein